MTAELQETIKNDSSDYFSLKNDTFLRYVFIVLAVVIGALLLLRLPRLARLLCLSFPRLLFLWDRSFTHG